MARFEQRIAALGFATPPGKVGREVTPEEGFQTARLTALAILGTLKSALGDFDRIQGGVRVFGTGHATPGFNRQPDVINGFSHLILGLFGASGNADKRSSPVATPMRQGREHRARVEHAPSLHPARAWTSGTALDAAGWFRS